MNTQQRILAAIESQVGDTGAELDQDEAWANTGTLSAVFPGELISPRRLAYNFQRDVVNFGGSGVRDESVGRVSARYADPAAVQSAVDTVAAFLVGRSA